MYEYPRVDTKRLHELKLGGISRTRSCKHMNKRHSRNHRQPQFKRRDSDGRHDRGRSSGGDRGDARRGSFNPEDFVMGRNCLQELLRHRPERLREVYFAELRDGGAGSQDGRSATLREQVEEAGVPLRQRSRDELNAMVQSDSHQGVVARVSPREFLTVDTLLQQARDADDMRLLALDGVLDPHNFGAVLRAAECFGVDAVVWSKNRAAPLGPVASKVSVGASELITLCPVPNLHRVIEALKEVGVWSVGAVVSPDATTIERFDRPRKWVLVMGSEGEGIQHLIEENLDFRVYIPMLGDVSSLNVSQATAVMLHSLVR